VADTSAYADLLASKAADAGVEVLEQTRAAVRTDPPRVNGERYDAVLVAAGAHTKRLLADAGLSVPLKPYRVQALTAGGPGEMPTFYDATGATTPDRTRRGARGRRHRTRRGGPGVLRPGGRRLVRGRDARPSHRPAPGLRPRRGAGVGGPLHRHAGPRPLLGELTDGLFVAAGWQGHGFMRAPATGEAIAEQMLGGDGIPAFDPARFTGDESFDIVEGMTVE